MAGSIRDASAARDAGTSAERPTNPISAQKLARAARR
jgi:hypothetical protein